jgi:hypothetical protein
MITKEEYLAAAAVVEAYHEQLKAMMSVVGNYTEPTLSDFIGSVDVSTRLRNALGRIAEQHGGDSILLEEVDASDLATAPNIGRWTVAEFVEKRNGYLRARRTPAPRAAEESAPVFIPGNVREIAV